MNSGKSISVNIHYISKEEMDELRDRFGVDHNPSVLSFTEPTDFIHPREEARPLGEIFLCPYYIKKEANERKVAVKDHEARLVTHGMLHVLGYTHDGDEDTKKMEGIERGLGF